MRQRRLPAAVLTLAVVLGACALAGAHAFLERGDPRVGSTVRTSPAQVRIWFTEKLEPAFSTIQVRDAAGGQVDKRDSRVDPGNAKLLVVSLPPLEPGTYKVAWRVLSVDTHVTDGDYIFKIAP